MTRPALEARHLATLQEMFAVCGNERRMQEADALDAAIRALSADRGEAVTRRQAESILAEVLDEADEALSVAAFDEIVNRFAGTTPPSPAESAAPSGVSDAPPVYFIGNDGRLGRYPAEQPDFLALLDRARIEYPGDGSAGTVLDWLEEQYANVMIAQPQPGRVEGMDHG